MSPSRDRGRLVAVASARAADLENDKVPTQTADAVKIAASMARASTRSPAKGEHLHRIGATARLDAGFNADGKWRPVHRQRPRISRNNPCRYQRLLVPRPRPIWFDAREMTQYGVLKAYFSGGFDASTGSSITRKCVLEARIISVRRGHVARRNRSSIS